MTTLDHDLPEDRAALIAALRAEGLDAVAYGTGGGNHHVAVAIAENVSIATASDASPCAVCILGHAGTIQLHSATVSGGVVTAATIAEAVAAFQGFWADRVRWLALVATGELNP